MLWRLNKIFVDKRKLFEMVKMWFWNKRNFSWPKIVFRFISPSWKYFGGIIFLSLLNFWIKWELFRYGIDFVDARLFSETVVNIRSTFRKSLRSSRVGVRYFEMLKLQNGEFPFGMLEHMMCIMVIRARGVLSESEHLMSIFYSWAS